MLPPLASPPAGTTAWSPSRPATHYEAGLQLLIQAGFGGHKLLVATRVYERVDPASVAELMARFAWSALRTYGINSPGRNHGLLLGTDGWTP